MSTKVSSELATEMNSVDPAVSFVDIPADIETETEDVTAVIGSNGKVFDPKRYVKPFPGRGNAPYMEVKHRLLWLRTLHPEAELTTELIKVDAEFALFKATVTIPGGQGSATGFGSETKKDFADFIEKAETKSIGRALINLGYGVQFAGDDADDAASAQLYGNSGGGRGYGEASRPAAFSGNPGNPGNSGNGGGASRGGAMTREEFLRSRGQ